MTDEEKLKNENLKAEYLLIQGQYEDFDKRALSLKALATPLLGAGIAVGVKEASALVLLATIIVALTLWILEALWKSFQYSLNTRIRLLEAWFRGEAAAAEIKPFQIFAAWIASWSATYSKLGKQLYIASQPFVALPYAVVIAFGTFAMLALPR